MFRFIIWCDNAVGTNACIFIDNCVFNARVPAHTYAWDTFVVAGSFGCIGLIIVRAKQYRAVHATSRSDDCPNSYMALAYARTINDAAVRNDSLINRSPVYLGGWQKTWAGVDRCLHFEEVKLR